jgi:hypothetical protein
MQKYENIYKIISHSEKPTQSQSDTNNNVSYDITDLLPTTSNTSTINTSNPIDIDMKNELKNFLKTQMTSSSSQLPLQVSIEPQQQVSQLIGSSELGNSSSGGISFSEF